MSEIFLPQTVLYTNVEHKESNPQWKETTYPLSALIHKGLIEAKDNVPYKIQPSSNPRYNTQQYPLPDNLLENLAINDLEITCQDAFMYSLRNKMYTMGQLIRVNYQLGDPPGKFNVEYPKGFCPEFIHLIKKRSSEFSGESWLALLYTFNDDISYGDLAYIPQHVLTFALNHGPYTLSPGSAEIAIPYLFEDRLK
tara:strand:+ start:289 stop:876 length:588 start_codon:yes stop_codon:yes gene_type:complete